jgi:6-phosphofructokinase 1
MGRNCGYLALMAGIAGGAEAIAIPEIESSPESLAETLREAWERGKSNGIIVIAEGATHDAEELIQYFKQHKERLGFELRSTILGHVQRGGAPGAYDRLLGSRLGAAAAEYLCAGNSGVLVGMIKGEIATTPHAEIAGKTKPIDKDLMRLAEMLTC